jgi:hypothetical protein
MPYPVTGETNQISGGYVSFPGWIDGEETRGNIRMINKLLFSLASTGNNGRANVWRSGP